MKAVVLAAGKGARLNPLTDRRAKPMIEVANRPVMEHILCGLRRHGMTDILVNLHYRPHDMLEYFGDGSAWGVAIEWRQQEQLTGPAGGVVLFDDLLRHEDAIVVVSGDALHDVDLGALVAFHRAHDAQLSVVMKKVRNAGRYGVGFVDDRQRIIAFKEKPPLDPSAEGLVSCGIYCLSGTLLDRIPRGVVYDFGAHLIPTMAADDDAVFCFETPSYWCDIGSHAELRQANLDAVAGMVDLDLPGRPVRDGVRVGQHVALPASVEVVPPVLIGDRAAIAPGARIVGPAVIGAEAVVGRGAYVARSVLLRGARVPDQSMVVDGLLGSLACSTNTEKGGV